MKLNSKLTGGLAWAGLVVVLAVPAADLLMGNKADSVKTVTAPQTDAVRTATVSPVVTPVTTPARPVVAEKDPVESFVSGGKKLPSYISDVPADTASAKPVALPTLVVPGVPQTTKAPVTTEVAALPVMNAGLEAPIPYPASKRPRPGINQPVVATAPAVKPAVTVDPVTTATATRAPLVIDEEIVQKREEAVARVLDDDIRVTSRPRIIESDELEEWDSGSLAEYLERKGLMSNTARAADATTFDEDGFFLDEGPNDSRSNARVVRRIRPADNFNFF